MSLIGLSYNDLQKECIRAKIGKCSGSKTSLIERLSKTKFETPRYEQFVEERDPSQYRIIKKIVDNMPSLYDIYRESNIKLPKYSLGNSWTKEISWKAIWEDFALLDSAGTDESLGASITAQFIDYITEESNKTIKKPHNIYYFFSTYPALSYVLAHLYPRMRIFATMVDLVDIYLDLAVSTTEAFNLLHYIPSYSAGEKIINSYIDESLLEPESGKIDRELIAAVNVKNYPLIRLMADLGAIISFSLLLTLVRENQPESTDSAIMLIDRRLVKGLQTTSKAGRENQVKLLLLAAGLENGWKIIEYLLSLFDYDYNDLFEALVVSVRSGKRGTKSRDVLLANVAFDQEQLDSLENIVFTRTTRR